ANVAYSTDSLYKGNNIDTRQLIFTNKIYIYLKNAKIVYQIQYRHTDSKTYSSINNYDHYPSS
ncbi:UNVERIFIED_CONTAM: hypothetical protein NY603_40755, partial [Bacteroidetes bacterium 56_B9]